MTPKLEDSITREDLEKERVVGNVCMAIVCDMQERCSRKGQYTRCAFKKQTKRCPFYITYSLQDTY